MAQPAQTRDRLAAGEAHLSAVDPVLGGLIARHGPCALVPASDLFGALVDSIISQQISVKAADAILRRFIAALPGGVCAPEPISASRWKTCALWPLARQSRLCAGFAGRGPGALDLVSLDRAPDEDIIGALTQVKGIGRWTAEMFLIFALGRLDVLPVDDLGFRRAVERNYGLPTLPPPATLLTLGQPWRPYRSIATWHLWRSLTHAGRRRVQAPAPPTTSPARIAPPLAARHAALRAARLPRHP